jgi:hypothetical protein
MGFCHTPTNLSFFIYVCNSLKSELEVQVIEQREVDYMRQLADAVPEQKISLEV